MLQQALVNYSLHGCSHMAAALAYYALFSIFPLLLVVLSLLGFALQFVPLAINGRSYMFEFLAINTSPDLAAWLDERLTEVQTLRSTAGLVGLAVLLFGASGVFTMLDEAFNQIWGLPVPDHGPLRAFLALLRRRFFAFLMVVALGVITLTVLLFSVTLRQLAVLTATLPYSEPFWYVVGLLVVPSLNWLILLLIFKIMPDTEVAWGDVWLASLVTTVLLEGAKRVFAWYVSAFGVANAYGAIGNVVVFVLLIYIAAQIVFLGGELSASYARHFGSRSRAEGQPAPVPVVPDEAASLERQTQAVSTPNTRHEP